MKKPWLVRIVIIAVCLYVLSEIVGGFHPETNDPKNIKYLLWKRGLYHLDPEISMDTMIGDANRESLVIGKSKQQLEKKFGFLTPIAQASKYDQDALRSMPIDTSRHEVYALRKSTWLVVFTGEKASDLILVKGF